MARTKKGANNCLRTRPLKNAEQRINNEQNVKSDIIAIFNEAQYVSKIDESLNRMINLYGETGQSTYRKQFAECLKKLLRAKHTDYFRQCCHFVCKFLKLISHNNDEQLIQTFAEITNHYMQISNDDGRLNSVFLVGTFLNQVDNLDEVLSNVLIITLSKRIRDKQASIRRHAVIAASKFQDHSLIKDALEFHFRCDPEIGVRKVLLQTMDTAIFGCGFLIEATQALHASLRTTAYQRLSKISPTDLKVQQLHQVLHNGLCERDRTVSFAFRSSMMTSWLTKLYDGSDPVNLLKYLDVINYTEDINKLLELLHSYHLGKPHQLEDGDSTGLHRVVLDFQRKWLNLKKLPKIEDLDEKMVTVWLSLIRFCKENQVIIKATKDPASQQSDIGNSTGESIEDIVNSQEADDEEAPLYELLTPDLIHLAEYVKQFTRFAHKLLEDNDNLVQKYEFIYMNLMKFLATYTIGDDSELKVVTEVLDVMLKENLLTLKFSNYMDPIVQRLRYWIFPTSSSLFVNYIAEKINDIRSHLEDVHQSDMDAGELNVFKDHPAELIQCKQMYASCLSSIRVSKVPVIMDSNLKYLSYAALEEPLVRDVRVRIWMIRCHGITALSDEDAARSGSTMTLLFASLFDNISLDLKTVAFQGLVDIMVKYDDLDVPYERLNRFLVSSLRDYGKYNPKNMTKQESNFMDTIVRGTEKLYYHKKLTTPEALAHLVMWWYHPRTPDKLKQHIGIFMPLFVRHASQVKKSEEDNNLENTDEEQDDWLGELLSNLFVKCIEYLHSYILGPGSNIMDDSDMNSLINYLCSLVPTSYHGAVMDVIVDKIDEISDAKSDIVKYLKRSEKLLQSLKAQPMIAGEENMEE